MKAIDKFKNEALKIKKIEEQAQNLYVKKYALQEKAGLLLADVIKEENLLQKAKWIIEENYGAYEAKTKTCDKAIEQLDNYLKITGIDGGYYHFSFKYSESICLNFDDGDVRIRFDDLAILVSFAKENKIDIRDMLDITNKEQKLQKELDSLRYIKSKMNE